MIIKEQKIKANRQKVLMKNKNRDAIVNALMGLLTNGHAHIPFERAIQNIPPGYRGVLAEGLPYSIWQLIVHIRIMQWDILEFAKQAKHKSPAWPDGFWPEGPGSPGEMDWTYSLSQIRRDKQEMIALLQDPKNNIFEPFPYDKSHSLVTEALLIADHTSYHTGQIIAIRRNLGIW